VKKVILVFILFCSIVVAKNGNIEKIKKALDSNEGVYSLFVKGSYINTFKNYKGVSKTEIQTQPMLLGTVGFKLFPDILGLTISYTNVLDRYYFNLSDREDDDTKRGKMANDVEYIDIYMKPITSKYGDIGFGYKKYTYIITVKNMTDCPHSILDVFSDGKNPQQKPGCKQYSSDTIMLGPKEEFSAKNGFKRYTISYNFPEISYLPKGSGFSFSREFGTKLVIADAGTSIKADYDAERYGIGIFRTYDELDYGFSLKQLEFYRIDFSDSKSGSKFVDSGKPIFVPFSDMGGDYRFYGVNAEVIYKIRADKKEYFVGLSLDYLKQPFPASINGEKVQNYSVETSYTIGLNFGVEFIF